MSDNISKCTCGFIAVSAAQHAALMEAARALKACGQYFDDCQIHRRIAFDTDQALIALKAAGIDVEG